MEKAALSYINGESDDLIAATAPWLAGPKSFPGETSDAASGGLSPPRSPSSLPPGSLVRPLTAEYFADAIKTQYEKIGLISFEVAKLCAQAQCLGKDEKRRLTKGLLPFERPKFSRLAAIGACAAFYEPDIKLYLPKGWTTLEQFVGATGDELRSGILQRLIWPTMTKKQAKAWANEYCAERIRRNAKRRMMAQQRDMISLSRDDRDFENVVKAYEAASPAARKKFLESYLPARAQSRSAKANWGFW